MERIGTTTGWIAIVTTLAACGADGDTGSGDAAAEAETSQATVELVGRGTVSSELPEFATTLSPDRDTIFFNRTTVDRSRIELLVSVRSDDAWTPARPFAPTEGIEAIDPFMAADGRRLYFSLLTSRPGASVDSPDLWYVDRVEGGWGEPIALPEPINSDSSDVFNSLASDGTMVFSSRRDAERRVYETRWTGDGWSDPVPIRFGDVTGVSNPAISPDGRFLVVSASLGEAAPPDLYVACRTDAGWGDLRRLPEPVNGPLAEFAPGIAGDFLYFTSERPGVVDATPDAERPPGDIYRTPVAVAAAPCGGIAD